MIVPDRDVRERIDALGVTPKIGPSGPEDSVGPAEAEFAAALDYYKRTKRRPYPTWSEVLRVTLALGYRKE